MQFTLPEFPGKIFTVDRTYELGGKTYVVGRAERIYPTRPPASRALLLPYDQVAQWAADRCDFSDHKARTLSRVLLDDFNKWQRENRKPRTFAQCFNKAFSAQFPASTRKHTNKGSVTDGVSIIKYNKADLL